MLREWAAYMDTIMLLQEDVGRRVKETSCNNWDACTYTTRNTDHPGQNELPDIADFHVDVLKHLCSQSHLKQHLNSTKDFEHSLLLYLIFLPNRIPFQNSTDDTGADTLATSSITAMSFKIILFQNSHNYLFLFQANDFWLCW